MQKISYSEANSVCLVATLINEEKFLDEWLIYHKLLGISHFYLYDDDLLLPLEKHLKPHEEYVTVIPWQGKEKSNTECNNQVMAYRHAWKNYLEKYEWVVFLDGDEFIVLREHDNINKFLAGFDEPAIALNWHIFGHNGYYEDPEDLVTTSLTRRKLLPVNNIKSITRTKAIKDIMNMHWCKLSYGTMVDANKKNYYKWCYPGKTVVAHINHYQCRSFNNWMTRADRGVNHFISGECPNEQIWRTSQEGVLREFITSIAFDKNEYVDEYMFKYSFGIRKDMFLLNRDATFLTNLNMVADLKELLAKIACLIQQNTAKITGIGLFDGQAGIALFLFNYGRFINDPEYESAGLTLIENSLEIIDRDTPINYLSGLAGFGSAVECLTQNCFLNINTDEILEDIDALLQYNVLTHRIADVTGLHNGAIGIGKYYLNRLNNPFTPAENDLKRNLVSVIGKIAELIETERAIDNELCQIIDFISASYKYLEGSARTKAKNKADNAVHQLISTNYSDNYWVGFEPLNTVSILFNAAKKFKDDTYLIQAQNILDKCKSAYSQPNDLEAGDSELLWLYYYRLDQNMPSDNYKRKALLWLEKTISALSTNLLADDKLTAGQITSLARTGMLLQYAVDKRISGAINLYY